MLSIHRTAIHQFDVYCTSCGTHFSNQPSRVAAEGFRENFGRCTICA